MPLWLQTQQGYTATWAGLVAAPSGMVAFMLAPLVARAATQIDLRCGHLLAAAFRRPTDAHRLRRTPTCGTMSAQYRAGAAMGTFFMSMTTLSWTGCRRIPSATGISNFARITGGAFAASITTTFWDRRETLHQSRLAEAANRQPAYTAAVDQLTQGDDAAGRRIADPHDDRAEPRCPRSTSSSLPGSAAS
jgi:DHA2 family multidrug resistance protein